MEPLAFLALVSDNHALQTIAFVFFDRIFVYMIAIVNKLLYLHY
jgi:hypothetical protein